MSVDNKMAIQIQKSDTTKISEIDFNNLSFGNVFTGSYVRM